MSIAVSQISKPGQKISRKTRILNAAEAEFAQHGYDGVTLRKIAKQAGVDVALTNYHFGSKHGLFEAVFYRRAEVLNQVRNDALDRCLDECAGAAPKIGDLVDAYFRPLGEIQASADEGWKHYFALVAWVNNSPKWGRVLMTDTFNPFVSRFLDAMKTALPDTDEQSIYWGYQFLSGALTLTLADTRRLDELSGGKASSADIETGYAHIIPFITAGLEAICT